MDMIVASPPPYPPPKAEQKELTPLERRRLNFFRAVRLSQSEIAFLSHDFDPGPEYD